LRLVIFIPSVTLKSGGPTRSVLGLAEAISNLCHDVYLVYHEHKDNLVFNDQIGSVTTIELKSWSHFHGPHIKDTTILHANGVWTKCSYYLGRYSSISKIPLINTPRGMLEPWAMNHKKWKKRLAWWLYQRRILQRCAGLHATAESEAANLRALGLKAPIAVIPNGITFPDEALAANRTYGTRRLLFLSRIHAKKGVVELVEAWARVRRAGWQLVIAGPDEGGHLAEVQARARKLGVEEELSFPGPLSDEEKWAVYTDADVFVLPTYSENFGIVVPEALACGTPVVTTHGAPWKLLEEERCGWWIPTGVEPLAAALEKAMDTPPEQLAQMGVRGRRAVQERFGWDKVARQMIDFYE